MQLGIGYFATLHSEDVCMKVQKVKDQEIFIFLFFPNIHAETLFKTFTSEEKMH